MINNNIQNLYTMVKNNLYAKSPIYSGNMKSSIGSVQWVEVGENKVQLIINAPYYDMQEFKKNNRVVPTGEVVNGMFGYANDVNLFGGFFTQNKSKYWVNRAIYEACLQFATTLKTETIDVVVDMQLPMK